MLHTRRSIGAGWCDFGPVQGFEGPGPPRLSRRVVVMTHADIVRCTVAEHMTGYAYVHGHYLYDLVHVLWLAVLNLFYQFSIFIHSSIHKMYYMHQKVYRFSSGTQVNHSWSGWNFIVISS